MGVFDQELALKPTLEPHHSERPAAALRKAFNLDAHGGNRAFNVTDAQIGGDRHTMLLSVRAASPSGSGHNEAVIRGHLCYATDVWPLMPLVGAQGLPVA